MHKSVSIRLIRGIRGLLQPPSPPAVAGQALF